MAQEYRASAGLSWVARQRAFATADAGRDDAVQQLQPSVTAGFAFL